MSNNPSLPDEKSALRRKIREILAAIPASEASDASARACALLQRQPAWHDARTILFYSSIGREIDLRPSMREALDSGRTVALPKFIAGRTGYAPFVVRNPETDLCPGAFGILEPRDGTLALSLNQLDLILVPGIAFDTGGRRLGRGKGYYDRLLAAIPGRKCGVAFDQQIVGEIPVESHDVVMNYILTPHRWLIVGQAAS